MAGLIYGATLEGMNAIKVEIEVSMAKGLFSFNLVGLPDTAVRESKERVRSALRSLGISLKGRIVVNLAPADMKKEGSLLDLPIALSVLYAMGECSTDISAMFCGELGMEGAIRRIKGTLSIAQLAVKMGVPLFCPAENSEEAALVPGLTAYAVSSLREAVDILEGVSKASPVMYRAPEISMMEDCLDMSLVKGQTAARRALEIAVAGHHNIYMSGPPGSGKTMLARCIPAILPPLNPDEVIEVTSIHSVAGVLKESVVTRPPFRSPHHTASSVSICGGGSFVRPGEISLAHRGILYMDELPEFRRDVLEALRQPLEDGKITVARAQGSFDFPARVMFVGAGNLCPCGALGSQGKICHCSRRDIFNYRKRLSGPIMDRIDIHVDVPCLSADELMGMSEGESSSVIAYRVMEARERQKSRLAKHNRNVNAEMTEKEIRLFCKIGGDTESFLRSSSRRLGLSGRGFSRVLKVARTIADIDGVEQIEMKHVAEAIQYRPRGEVSE